MIELEKACESFRQLLCEQLARVEKMRTEKVDYANKPVITMVLLTRK